MRTRKLLALTMSILMIISANPTTIFAAPSMATVIETTHEHNAQAEHEHHEHHEEDGTAELAAIIDNDRLEEVYKTFDNGFYINYDVYTVCKTCKSYVYVMNDYDHSIFIDSISADFSTPGNAKFTFVFTFYDCNNQQYSSEPSTQSVPYNCEEDLFKMVFSKVNGQYAYATIRRNATSHTGASATCTNAGNCTLCNASYTTDHSYSTSYTQAIVDGTYKHRHMCNYGCGNYTDESPCSGGTATCKDKAVCSVCKNSYGETSSVHSGDTDGDHKCNLCGLEISGCKDEDKNHICDICKAILSECDDNNNDHYCDTCKKTLSECSDDDIDHYCDICKAEVSECDYTDNNGFCTICDGYEPAALNEDGYYEIANAGQLYWFAKLVNAEGETEAKAILIADIDLEDRTWYPIGVYGDAVDESGVPVTVQYNGTFDGNFHTVSNFTAIGTGSQGLIGYTSSNASVKNLGVINATVSGWNAGAVLAYSGTAENCFAIDCEVTAYTTASSVTVHAGAVAGTQQATVKNCFAYNCNIVVGEGKESNVRISPIGGQITKNCYYGNVTASNGTFDTKDGETEKTSDQFASGEIAYILQGNQENEVWGQKCDVDLLPVLGGQKVYRGYNSCSNVEMVYSNSPLSETRPEHDYDNGVCTVCYHEVVAKVGDVYYETLDEAVAAATGENALVTLVSYVELSEQLVITSGSFTLDLNGKTLSSEGFVLYIGGTADIKITDSSEEKNGAIFTSGDRFDAITLYDSAKLEIAGGTIEAYNGKAISMSYAGNASKAELTVSGGTLFTNGNNVIFAKGKKVTVTGGVLHSEESEIYYSNGSIDLSSYPDALGFELYTDSTFDSSKFDAAIPEGYAFDVVTETSALGVTSTRYTVIRAPELYIPVELLRLDDNTNTRYAEINGIQSEIEAVDDTYYVQVGEENLLIEIVEKTADGEFVKSQYFYVDMTEKKATKLSLDSYMTTDGKKSVRLSSPMGIRFRASIIESVKSEETAFVIDEYGFIIALEDHLNGAELNFDFNKYVSGIAYNKADGKNVIFDISDGKTIFTGVLHGIPVSHYKTNIVCKTYTKITVDGKQFIVYGEAVTGNVYDTAKGLIEQGGLDEETENKLYQIILDYENETGINGDELYPKA